MGFLSNLFGGKTKQAMLDAIENGAKVVDVRTVPEFKTGNVNGSINIPLNQLNDNAIKRIKKLKKPIIVCCASGMRSASAKGILHGAGIEVYNGGAWHKVDRLLAS